MNTRHKYHQQIVRYMRRLNKRLATDAYLGLNRFRVDMYSENWHKYEDNSGGQLRVVFKLTDHVTNNTAYFIADNYAYRIRIGMHVNDFLVRCSSGMQGHYPSLDYIAYDVHQIRQYDGEIAKNVPLRTPDKYVVNTYSWLKSVQF